MAIDEAMRHRIHDRLETLLGSEEAAALMAALPASEVATKDDLEHLREVLMLHTTATCADLGSSLRAEMNQLYRWTVGSVIASVSLGLAAGQLLG